MAVVAAARAAVDQEAEDTAKMLSAIREAMRPKQQSQKQPPQLQQQEQTMPQQPQQPLAQASTPFLPPREEAMPPPASQWKEQLRLEEARRLEEAKEGAADEGAEPPAGVDAARQTLNSSDGKRDEPSPLLTQLGPSATQRMADDADDMRKLLRVKVADDQDIKTAQQALADGLASKNSVAIEGCAAGGTACAAGAGGFGAATGLCWRILSKFLQILVKF